MPSNCLPAPPLTSLAPSQNITNILKQRWEHSPDDDRKRLELCWGYNDCGDCHRSEGFCGWCPLSQTCLPLPTDRLSKVFPLLSPMRYKFICATGPERFELRTSGLGCQVSTITFLTSIVTIFSTLFGVLVLYGLLRLVRSVVFATRAVRGGWVIHGDGRQEVWVRKSEGWGRWWRRMRGRLGHEEVEEVDGGTVERSWRFWRGFGKRREEMTETRPLLR